MGLGQRRGSLERVLHHERREREALLKQEAQRAANEDRERLERERQWEKDIERIRNECEGLVADAEAGAEDKLKNGIMKELNLLQEEQKRRAEHEKEERVQLSVRAFRRTHSGKFMSVYPHE